MNCSTCRTEPATHKCTICGCEFCADCRKAHSISFKTIFKPIKESEEKKKPDA